MKVGIVVPFSWSFWGAVNEHAELQAAALEALGSAIDRRSDVAFDAAVELVRSSRRRITGALAAFQRAGYPVK